MATINLMVNHKIANVAGTYIGDGGMAWQMDNNILTVSKMMVGGAIKTVIGW